MPQVMQDIYGADALAHIDFSHYERPGHERDALYDNSLVREELGFALLCRREAAPPKSLPLCLRSPRLLCSCRNTDTLQRAD